MDNQPKEDATTEIESNDNIGKLSTSTSCSTAFLLEIESKTNENQRLCQDVLKAKLSIENLEKLITDSATQLRQLTNEQLKAKKELNQQRQEAEAQSNYQAKEVETLMAELELSKSLLSGRWKRLERLSHRNAALRNEVTNNKYKIFSMHFSSSTDDEETDHSSSQNESSQTTSKQSTVVTSDEAETSPNTTSEELESTNESY